MTNSYSKTPLTFSISLEPVCKSLFCFFFFGISFRNVVLFYEEKCSKLIYCTTESPCKYSKYHTAQHFHCPEHPAVMLSDTLPLSMSFCLWAHRGYREVSLNPLKIWWCFLEYLKIFILTSVYAVDQVACICFPNPTHIFLILGKLQKNTGWKQDLCFHIIYLVLPCSPFLKPNSSVCDFRL